jgi:hypothetical protein
VGVVCTKEAATAGGNAPLTSGKKAETDVFLELLIHKQLLISI